MLPINGTYLTSTDPPSPSSSHGRLTDYWVVRFASHVDIDKLPSIPGLRRIAALFGDTVVFHFAWPRLPFPLKLGDTILEIERQVARKRYVRAVSLPPNDPLYRGAWNLHGRPGIDVNIEAAWQMGVTGVGSTIAIVDDGVSDHPEFQGRFCSVCSKDFNEPLHDSVEPVPWDFHGTAAAGVAAGAVNNGVCSAGIAPGAQVSGLRILAKDVTDAQEAEALTYQLARNTIFSNSWGPNDDGMRLEGPGPVTKRAFYEGITNGRGGLGTIYVWAGGNGRARMDSCNYDGYANSRYTIAVGAFDSTGNQAWYSEPCASLILSTPSSGNIPPDISSAATRGTCTEHFTGTSVSCPLVAGAVALMLEVRPNLTWRDVQGVLIRSAKPINPSDSDWSMNGASLRVNHKYGFGRLDCAQAVTTAREWNLLGPEVSSRIADSASRPIPDNNAAGIEVVLAIPDDIVVESIEVSVMAAHGFRGQLWLAIDSPMGTRSVLQEPHNDYSSGIYWTYTSMRHWGEGSRGAWRFTISDRVPGIVGSLQSVMLSVYGHARSSA